MERTISAPGPLCIFWAGAMAKPPLDDDLWILIAPPLRSRSPRRVKHPSRNPVNDRMPTAILFVLKAGIPWEVLCGRLRYRDRLDQSHPMLGSSSYTAQKGTGST